MVERIIKCPICNELIHFSITKDAIMGKKLPVPCLVQHSDHEFIAYVDSELNLCDIEAPFIIQAE